jgi:uncharacterized damage-inducible protein DinB
MSDNDRELLVVETMAGCEPEIGRLLWMLEDVRQRTKEKLEGIETAVLNWQPPTHSNSIGSLLYHIAAIELDWLYAEVLQADVPADMIALFPWEVREVDGRLTATTDSVTDHLQRLDAVRARLLAVYREMDTADFRRLRHLDPYDVTPEWVLYHFIQHEAEHQGQIGEIRLLAQL